MVLGEDVQVDAQHSPNSSLQAAALQQVPLGLTVHPSEQGAKLQERDARGRHTAVPPWQPRVIKDTANMQQ